MYQGNILPPSLQHQEYYSMLSPVNGTCKQGLWLGLGIVDLNRTKNKTEIEKSYQKAPHAPGGLTENLTGVLTKKN